MLSSDYINLKKFICAFYSDTPEVRFVESSGKADLIVFDDAYMVGKISKRKRYVYISKETSLEENVFLSNVKTLSVSKNYLIAVAIIINKLIKDLLQQWAQ